MRSSFPTVDGRKRLKAGQEACPTGMALSGTGLLACLLGLAMFTAAQAQAPGREILAGGGTLGSGIAIQYKTLAVGPGLSDSIGGGFRIDGDKLYRILVDNASRQYLGYQLAIAAGPSAGAYSASIEPVTGIEDLLRRFAPGAVLRPAPSPKCPDRKSVV